MRIVSVSSRLHELQKKPFQFDDLHFTRRKYNNWAAYGQSKTANVLFTKQIAKYASPLQLCACTHGGLCTWRWAHH